MKRLFALSALLVVLCGVASAQTAEELRAIDPLYAYEFYRPYPLEQIGSLSRPPKGYEPFYISHLGRHGSRYHSVQSLYDDTLDLLRRASEADELTPTGRRFLADWQLVAEAAKGRIGELSPLGIEQQVGITRRMVEAYPEIFNKRRCRIDCRSTVAPRCILSMTAATNTLSAMLPKAEIRVEASEANTYLKSYASLNSVKMTSIPFSDSLRRANMPAAEPFIARLFKAYSKVAESIADTNDFMYNTFLATAVLGSTPMPEVQSLDYIFTEEERAAVWRASNIRRYALTGPSAKYHKAILNVVALLLGNIIETADRAIATGDEQATLRYAHDVTVISLTAALGIKCGNVVTDDYARVSYDWQCSTVTPMGANIQIVFYRNRKGDVLVKVLHNEREQILDPAVGKPVEGVYYRWSDVKAYLSKVAAL